MEINTFLNTEMTSSNLNKFMRTSIKLNSKILSKNTSEIVNTCIGKLYKQVPLTFRKGLQQTKIAAANKFVSQGPLERLTKQEWQSKQTSFIKAPIYKNQMLSNLMTINKKLANLTPRRFLRTHNYKIYNSKRYYSSASSSNGSSLYGKEDKKHTARSCYVQASNNLEKVVLKRSPVMQLNQYMCSNANTLQRAMKVSGRIQKDLIIIDKILKDRLRVTGKGQNMNSGKNLMPILKIKPQLNNKDFKEDYNKKQIAPKEVELSNKHKSLNLACEKITSHAKKNTLIIGDSLKLLKPQKVLESKEVPDFLRDIQDKETKLKSNSRKSFRSFKKQDPITYIELLAKSCQNQVDNKKVHKALKMNSRAAPSATYCLLKSDGFTERHC